MIGRRVRRRIIFGSLIGGIVALHSGWRLGSFAIASPDLRLARAGLLVFAREGGGCVFAAGRYGTLAVRPVWRCAPRAAERPASARCANRLAAALAPG